MQCIGMSIYCDKGTTFQKMQIFPTFLVLVNLAQAVKIPPLKYAAFDNRLFLSIPSSPPSPAEASQSNLPPTWDEANSSEYLMEVSTHEYDLTLPTNFIRLYDLTIPLGCLLVLTHSVM